MLFLPEIKIEFLQSLLNTNMTKHLGIEFTKIGEDFLEGTMPVDHRTQQPMGLLHGGASCVLAETLGSVGSQLVAGDPGKNKVVGVEINANHLNSAKAGIVRGILKPIKIGRTLHVWEINIYDENDTHICISRLTTMIIKSP